MIAVDTGVKPVMIKDGFLKIIPKVAHVIVQNVVILYLQIRSLFIAQISVPLMTSDYCPPATTANPLSVRGGFVVSKYEARIQFFSLIEVLIYIYFQSIVPIDVTTKGVRYEKKQRYSLFNQFFLHFF